MPNSLQISRRRIRKSGGAVMMETALTLLPLFALITGFFDVTFAIFNWSTLQNAVREGVRYAVTFQTTGSLGQDASIAQIVVNNAMGVLAGTTAVDSTTAGQLSITTKYYTQQNPNTAVASPGGNIPGNIVEVSVQNYQLQWMVPLSGTLGGGNMPGSPFRPQTPAAINVYARDILGGYPVGVTSVNR
jgi:Flp pilus assembly protein TadG